VGRWAGRQAWGEIYKENLSLLFSYFEIIRKLTKIVTLAFSLIFSGCIGWDNDPLISVLHAMPFVIKLFTHIALSQHNIFPNVILVVWVI
jgi:hypothetical protein